MTWIVDEIEARGGSVPFDEFMELALYHREHGYYSSAMPRYGRGGDYLTAPTASEWYTRVFARVLARAARSAGPLRLVDVASGDGSFVAGVLASFLLACGPLVMVPGGELSGATRPTPGICWRGMMIFCSIRS